MTTLIGMEPQTQLGPPRFKRMDSVTRAYKRRNVLEAFAAGATSTEAAFAASTSPTWIAFQRNDPEFDRACRLASECGVLPDEPFGYPDDE